MLHKQNRDRLFDSAEGALIVLTAYDEVQQSGDMSAPFLQEASFWWVSGISEAGWKIILDTSRRHATLVRPERSKVDLIFNGALSDDEIRSISGIQTIIEARDFETELRQLHRHHAVAQVADNAFRNAEMVANPAQNDLREVCERVFESVQDCTKLLNRLRAIKQSAELERMQRAIDLTVEAFKSVRTNLEKSKTENALEAEFIYKFRQKNATHAYEPIVAAGENACTLHYVANDAKINARDLVLIDIGARVDGYAADITRTYCRNPTKRQRAVHAAVERVHDEVISLIEPGLLVADYIRESDLIMKHALNELGLLEDLQDDETFRRYFPHAMSHGLGVDTHDSLGAPRFFEPGMVLTVEPGIYIDEEGIGVRIEDDILVTKTGRKNLSAALSTAL